MMKNTLLLAGALGAALTLSMNSWAMGPAEDMTFDASHIVSHLADRLDLSDDRQAATEAAPPRQGPRLIPVTVPRR